MSTPPRLLYLRVVLEGHDRTAHSEVRIPIVNNGHGLTAGSREALELLRDNLLSDHFQTLLNQSDVA